MIVEPIYADLGDRVRALRRARDMTQEQLADATKLGRTSITNFETGKQRVGIDDLIAIAAGLGVELGDLFATTPLRKPGPGVHQRLTEIMHEIVGVNMESMLDGAFYLTAEQRGWVRDAAADLTKLIDEYDRIDPLAPDSGLPKDSI